MPLTIHYQIIYLFIMALTKECKGLFLRKFFYLFTCEYCFSHYITLLFLIITRYHLLYNNWRGYIVSFFALVWIANIYMSLFGLVRVGMKKEGIEAKIKEVEWQECEDDKGKKV